MAACYKEEGPLLVVCPASMRLVWAEELERWLPFLTPLDVHLGNFLPCTNFHLFLPSFKKDAMRRFTIPAGGLSSGNDIQALLSSKRCNQLDRQMF